MTETIAPSLERIAPLLRLDGPDGPPPDVVDRRELRCPRSGRRVAPRDGVFDLLGDAFAPTASQKALDTPASAWIYERTRPHLGPWLGMPTFDREVANVIERIGLQPGDTVLDIACGQGNFTTALARRVGDTGIVIGVDIAGAMLARAARAVRKDRLHNVVLLRADALALPLANAVIPRLNCSGGLHQFPDLGRAVAEMARVCTPGARLSVSGFASANDRSKTRLRRFVERFDSEFVPMDALSETLVRVGFEDVHSDMPGGFVGYQWATRSARLDHTPGSDAWRAAR